MADPGENLRLIKYTILQTTLIPSLLCDLLVFAHFIRRWRTEILVAPQNHAILCLLAVSFTQKLSGIVFLLYYLRWGVVLQQTYAFCATWNWLDYSLLAVSVNLLAWCCIERHLFVFHNQMMKRIGCRLVFHYLPLTVCLIYTPLFYAVVIFFPVCAHEWDYTFPLCGAPCYSYLSSLGTFDCLFHNGLPILIILLANVSLVSRILWQKMKQQRAVQWNRQRRLVIQLSLVSSLFLIFVSPLTTVGVVQALWSRTFLMDVQFDYFYYLVYFSNQLLPFVIVSSLPKMRQELREWITIAWRLCRCRTQIRPMRSTTAVADRLNTSRAIPLRTTS